MSIENARKHLENAANSGRFDTKWEASVELCLDAIIDTLEMRDNRTTVPAPTVTPEQVVVAWLRWCSDPTNIVSTPSQVLALAVRGLSRAVVEDGAQSPEWAPWTAIARAVQEMQDE